MGHRNVYDCDQCGAPDIPAYWMMRVTGPENSPRHETRGRQVFLCAACLATHLELLPEWMRALQPEEP